MHSLQLMFSLAHYDPKLPLGLACDASSVGVGAMFFHKYSDGSERPIAYASKSLTSAEKNYSQEVLSIIFGVKNSISSFMGGHFCLQIINHYSPYLDTRRVSP